MKICIINGSPKASKSTSELLIEYFFFPLSLPLLAHANLSNTNIQAFQKYFINISIY